MIPQTLGIRHDVGRVALVECVRNAPLDALNIQNQCFLLLLVREGSAFFHVGSRSFEAVAPCMVCFDETANPTVTDICDLRCDAVFFHPKYLNVNMTFDRLRRPDYTHLAMAHDLFLMQPFTDPDRFVFPVPEAAADKLASCFDGMCQELQEQPDWYWSCRSRSYFMEMMLLLERSYGVTDQSHTEPITNRHLKKAVIFIESHYQDSLRLTDISTAAALNHTTLTELFHRELNTTPMDYLWNYRICVAKKHLEFTNLPIKDVALRCGFKTAQHFSRKFESATGQTPTNFRTHALQSRKSAF